MSAESTQVNQLFMIYIGGSAPGAHIELHDVRFVVAPVIEATFPALRQQWFGSQKGLHMDSYVALHHVDDYRISLTKEPADNQGVSSHPFIQPFLQKRAKPNRTYPVSALIIIIN